MPLKFQPSPGMILRCDFNDFKAPEMTKIRPVIVLSPRHSGNTTVVVAALSTTPPIPAHKYHMKINLPGENIPDFLGSECWLKGNMIYALSLKRLDLYRFERDKMTGKRVYYKDKLPPEEFMEVRKSVAHAIGIHGVK